MSSLRAAKALDLYAKRANSLSREPELKSQADRKADGQQWPHIIKHVPQAARTGLGRQLNGGSGG